eukprot:1999082-Alexandrium_andersonii.AAC.1
MAAISLRAAAPAAAAPQPEAAPAWLSGPLAGSAPAVAVTVAREAAREAGRHCPPPSRRRGPPRCFPAGGRPLLIARRWQPWSSS